MNIKIVAITFKRQSFNIIWYVSRIDYHIANENIELHQNHGLISGKSVKLNYSIQIIHPSIQLIWFEDKQNWSVNLALVLLTGIWQQANHLWSWNYFYLFSLNFSYKYIYIGLTFLIAQLVKNLPAMQETQVQSSGWEDFLEEEVEPTPVFLPEKFHEQRNLAGYSQWGCTELDTMKWLCSGSVTTI